MIHVTYENGDVWALDPADSFAVSGDSQPRQVSEIKSITLVTDEFAVIQATRARADGTLAPARALVIRDPATDVKIVWPGAVEGFLDVAKEITRKCILVVGQEEQPERAGT